MVLRAVRASMCDGLLLPAFIVGFLVGGGGGRPDGGGAASAMHMSARLTSRSSPPVHPPYTHKSLKSSLLSYHPVSSIRPNASSKGPACIPTHLSVALRVSAVPAPRPAQLLLSAHPNHQLAVALPPPGLCREQRETDPIYVSVCGQPEQQSNSHQLHELTLCSLLR